MRARKRSGCHWCGEEAAQSFVTCGHLPLPICPCGQWMGEFGDRGGFGDRKTRRLWWRAATVCDDLWPVYGRSDNPIPPTGDVARASRRARADHEPHPGGRNRLIRPPRHGLGNPASCLWVDGCEAIQGGLTAGTRDSRLMAKTVLERTAIGTATQFRRSHNPSNSQSRKCRSSGGPPLGGRLAVLAVDMGRTGPENGTRQHRGGQLG
jgi:hypothetical protein